MEKGDEELNSVDILADAFEYIELNLQNDIKTEDVAAYCYCSKSVLEKMFRFSYHLSVHDYIVRRRMMKAAKQIMEEPETNLIDVALSFGYSTNESFTRAFKKVWNIAPSEFRSKSRYSELFPRLYPPFSEEGDIQMPRNVDISELYDLFVMRKNCYFVCCDIKHMIAINDISRKAGDLAILESLNRMEKAAGDKDIFFRIGGDEFVLLTNSEDIAYAGSVAENIRKQNGAMVKYEDGDFPLELHVSVIKLENKSVIRYNELFDKLHETIEENK